MNFDTSIFWRSKLSSRDKICRKTIWHILNVKNIEFKQRKFGEFFQTRLLSSFTSFYKMPQVNSETNSLSSIINIVC